MVRCLTICVYSSQVTLLKRLIDLHWVAHLPEEAYLELRDRAQLVGEEKAKRAIRAAWRERGKLVKEGKDVPEMGVYERKEGDPK